MKTNKSEPPSGNDNREYYNIYGLHEFSDLDESIAEADPEAKVLKALLQRPGFSIRARLALVFSLFLILSTVMIIGAILMLDKLENKFKFLEIADNFDNEIQQARRYEKNFFLYRSDLNNVLVHIDKAAKLLTLEKPELDAVIGQANMVIMERHLVRYKELILKLNNQDLKNSKAMLDKIENELRVHGAEMISFALKLSNIERKKISNMINLARWVPIILLGFLIVLTIYSIKFLSLHILKRLTRLVEATRRIADGDITPVLPTRRFRDEFTNLSVAMTIMTHKLRHRHDVLIQSHKLRAVGTLTAGIAHELNNPINNIMLTAEGLKEDFQDLTQEEQFDMISDLVSQAERSKKIVCNLLEFARESEMETSLLDIKEIIHETQALANNQMKIHKIKVTTNIQENLPPVHGDKQYLTQVFLNLMLNAQDSMEDGGTLCIEGKRAKETGFIAINITDTGKGIPEHIIGNIFDPFFTTKSTGKGTGLGLSVSLGIIRKHGGDIRVKSKLGTGTTFTVLIPISDVPAQIISKDSDSSRE